MTNTAAYHQNLKLIRNISFQYPFIVYVNGSKEVWIQDLNNNIKVLYFDSNITCVENVDMSNSYDTSVAKIGLILDFEHFYKVGK